MSHCKWVFVERSGESPKSWSSSRSSPGWWSKPKEAPANTTVIVIAGSAVANNVDVVLVWKQFFISMLKNKQFFISMFKYKQYSSAFWRERKILRFLSVTPLSSFWAGCKSAGMTWESCRVSSNSQQTSAGRSRIAWLENLLQYKGCFFTGSAQKVISASQ